MPYDGIRISTHSFRGGPGPAARRHHQGWQRAGREAVLPRWPAPQGSGGGAEAVKTASAAGILTLFASRARTGAAPRKGACSCSFTARLEQEVGKLHNNDIRCQVVGDFRLDRASSLIRRRDAHPGQQSPHDPVRGELRGVGNLQAASAAAWRTEAPVTGEPSRVVSWRTRPTGSLSAPAASKRGSNFLLWHSRTRSFNSPNALGPECRRRLAPMRRWRSTVIASGASGATASTEEGSRSHRAAEARVLPPGHTRSSLLLLLGCSPRAALAWRFRAVLRYSDVGSGRA